MEAQKLFPKKPSQAVLMGLTICEAAAGVQCGGAVLYPGGLCQWCKTLPSKHPLIQPRLTRLSHVTQQTGQGPSCFPSAPEHSTQSDTCRLSMRFIFLVVFHSIHSYYNILWNEKLDMTVIMYLYFLAKRGTKCN